MSLFNNLALGSLLCLALLSCEKKYLEIVPVAEKVQDLSVPGGKNMKFLSFPTEQIGYAASDTNFIYKTTDGGATWQQRSLNNSLISPYLRCAFLEFYDTQNGICVMGSESGWNNHYILTTSDGGNTWNLTESSRLAGITPDVKAYAYHAVPGDRHYEISESVDKGKTFKNLVTLFTGDPVVQARVFDNVVYLAMQDGGVVVYDPVKKDTLNYHIQSHSYHYDLKDLIFKKEAKAAVFEGGKINGRVSDLFHPVSLQNDYDEHAYNYYSVDAYSDLIVAVGEKTMATNMDVQDEYNWHEVFDSKGNGWKPTFYKIKFTDANHFYVGGNNGLIWKMKL